MHPLTNSAISKDIPFHQYWSFKRVVSFLAPEWLIQWASARTNGTNNNGTIITDKPDFNFLFKIPLSINKVPEVCVFFGFRVFLLVFVKGLRSQKLFQICQGSPLQHLFSLLQARFSSRYKRTEKWRGPIPGIVDCSHLGDTNQELNKAVQNFC